MSDWIKENKFAAAMLGISLLALFGTYMFSGSKSAAYDASKGDFDTSVSKYNRLIGMKPFPNTDNLEDRKKEVTAYRGQVEGLQKALLAYRPEKFEQVDASGFSSRVKEVGDELKAIYKEKNIGFPAKWQLGFETYTGSPPKDGATAHLSYELDGFKWLYGALADAGPSELLNVYRARLAVEDGEVVAPKPTRRRGRQPKTLPKPYQALPIELTFRGSESSLRKFLESLAGSKDYFYVIRSMRIQNTKPASPPKQSDANFEEVVPDEEEGDGGEFIIPGEDGGVEKDEDGLEEVDLNIPAPEVKDAAPSGEQKLSQVLGAEEVNVFLQLELILFEDGIELPASK